MIRRKPKRKDPVRWIGGVLKKSAVSFLAGTLVLTSLTFMDGDPVETQAASADNMTIIFQRDGKNTVTHNGQAEGTFTYNGINGSGVSYGTLNLDNANYYGNTDIHVNIGQTKDLYAPSADTDYTGKIGFRGGYEFYAAGGKGGNLTNVQDNQTGKTGSSYGGYGTAIASGTYDYNTGTSITYRKGSNGASYDGLRNWNYWYPNSEERNITSDNLQYNNAKFYAHTGNEYRSYMLTAQYGSASYIQVSGNNYIVAGGGGAGTVAFHQRSDGSKWVTAQDGQHADVTPNVPSGKAYFNPTSSGMTLHYSDYVSPNVNAGRIVGTGVRQGVQATNGQWYKTDIVTGWLADSGTYNNPVIFEKTYPGYSGYGTRNGNVIIPNDNAYAGLAGVNAGYTGNPYIKLKCNYKIVVINNPTRPGFNFTGWTNLKNCQLLANSNGQSTFKVTGTDSSIEATWSSNSYTLTINPNGGIYNGTTANTVKTLPAETNYEVTEIPTRTGYDFVGWKRTGSGSLHSGTAEAVNSMIKVAEKADSDGTAYTNYSMNVTNTGTDTWWPGFTAFHYPYTAGHTYIMSYDARVNNSSGLVYSQIRNSGFDNNYDFNYATGNLNDVTNGWEHRTIERTFQSTTSQNGSAVTTNPVVEFYCGVAVGKTGKFSFDLKNITIYDATAKKYVTSKSATVKSGSTVTMGGGNTTLTAVWKAKEYKLTLNPNSGTFEDGTTKAKTLSPNLSYGLGNWWDISKYPASRKGYILDGWYDKASGGEKVYQADGSCVDGKYWKNKKYQYEGDLTVYAQWKRNACNVKIIKGDHVASATGDGDYAPGEEVTISAKADNGYEIVGWEGTYNTTDNPYKFPMPEQDVEETVTAQPIQYQIRYDYKGGTADPENPSDYNIETPDFTLNNPTKEGYEFEGWTGSNGDTPQETVTIPKGSTGDLNYVANWKPIQYVIHFDGNGATSGSTPDVTGTYDEDVTIPENGFERETDTGKSKFLGWSTDPNSTDPEYKPGDVVKNLTNVKDEVITVYAIWDDCPNIEAHDLYYTLTQAQNGDITENELLSYAKATDREDGEISPGADLEKGTAFTVWDYQAEDFLNFQHEGSVTETYQVIDSQGNIFQKQITVYVVDTTPKEVANAGTTRFINKKYFNKTALNGGLADDSLWRTDAEYNSILRSALENLENDASEKTYHFTHEDILNMKQFIKDNGVGNSRSADALTRFYETFMR